MKKVLVFVMLAAAQLSCRTSQNVMDKQPIKIQEFERDEYIVLDKVYGEATAARAWLLFIPIGGKSDEKLYEIAYDKALKSAASQDADGILQPRYTYDKISVPLLLVGWSKKTVTAEGKAFRIKTEAEYNK